MNKLFKIICSRDTVAGFAAFVFKLLPVYIYVKLFKKKENVWLFSERPTDARDNAYWLYRWVRENHPEQRVIYAIRKRSQDYQNVSPLGEVVEYGSYRHWYYYYSSVACCGTTWGICIPNSFAFLLSRHILPTHSKRVFLQHGITKDYMPEATFKKLVADIFVCGAFPEWEFINCNFGYPSGSVKYLGFSRFDYLKNTVSTPMILYMPTWRTWLRKEENGFEETEYYQHISSLLSSELLTSFLDQNNISFVFFSHPTIRNSKVFFEKFASTHIQIYNNDDMDLQKLICSSNMLITDYSSIYFDFAYLEKPVLYYHFDYEKYREQHFKKGYFDYIRDGFGPIFHTEVSLIEAIEATVLNNWEVQDEYHKRAERFFPKKDCNNCLRHYEELKLFGA